MEICGNMTNKNTKQLSLTARILNFIIGLVILTVLMIYSIQWDNLPFAITFFEQNVTSYVLPAVFVLTGVIASALLLSSFDGKWRLR